MTSLIDCHPNRGNIKNNSLLLVTIKHNQYG
uniref:Uncharacterized protein n=1 Tax=virus sp. ctx9V1 TaxID=2828001 RepID=A0A8S5RD46_9VIRU|nr:MAG TPA: hypothetical protein [virus sp. ctx9V1]